MRVEHKLNASGRCPVDGAIDSYKIVVRVQRVLKVEDILAAVQKNTAEPVFQERLTETLSAELDAEVETICIHSGVETTCVAP